MWLLIASYFFYMCWHVNHVVLLLFATGVSYVGGLLIAKAKSQNAKKVLLGFSITGILAVLFLFKYVKWEKITLPMGISFYSFQAISYLIDVYRGDTEIEKNPFRFALYISFFPQLVAGPIERSKNLLGQLREKHPFNFEMFRDGMLLMLWGFFLKVFLADRIAVYVDFAYGNYNSYPGAYLVLATVLFAVQIYCDFYGYSIIAMGSAKILGIKLMENFDTPYYAKTVGEFWRRWHVSLTSWFKDYVYIPLGGSRKGTIRKYLNKMIVFLLSGLWHGADLSFVVWGGLNGFYQVAGEATEKVRKKITLRSRVGKAAITFLLVDFAWIFFRAASIKEACGIIKSIFTTFNPWVLTDGSIYTCGLGHYHFTLVIIGLFILGIADFCKLKGICIREKIIKLELPVRWTIYILAFLGIMIFGFYSEGAGISFIYFQF
ncbi:MAG: MBOAT family protein [Lachnospiraceae bacterium]|nr:MBOAT family protein [Lachnospiraceae bacterium]